ncbi:MAG: hypothetical protein ACN4EH_04100, partial [Methyloceanibacter sp.]
PGNRGRVHHPGPLGHGGTTAAALLGTEIMLPDDKIEVALQSLTELQQEHGVLERDWSVIDLRLLDRITVRTREAAIVPPDDIAPSDVPTVATGTTPKGKT